MENMSEGFTVTALVSDSLGALSRIARVYARRGCSIDKLRLDSTADPNVSVVSIGGRALPSEQTQVLRQLEKLYDVKRCELICEEKRSECFVPS